MIFHFYAAAGQTVAVRTVQDAQDVLKWMLTDHLGSAVSNNDVSPENIGIRSPPNIA